MRRFQLLAPLAAALLLAGPALAEDHGKKGRAEFKGGEIPGLSTKPEDVVAGTYNLDPTHVNVTWMVSHLGLSNYQGRFNDINGTLTIDPAKPEEAALSITIKTDSVDVLSDKLEGELKGEEGFNAAEYPEITFTSTKVEVLEPKDGKKGKGRGMRRDGAVAKVTGDLSMLGETKPVTLHVTLVGTGEHPFAKKQAVGFQARGTFNRSDFGFTQWAPFVGDTVRLNIGAEFVAAE